ncbi:regulatory inactivation of DnaA Hda protein [Candidatus Ruthia magnifica str. Cm (Calyptogena magnifica)]|uniref:Regulatory inactivation of DnaA Hda protein n=1 Tax=Ruthia magnifica subsp. Calyptogena magnifica TaxID=413404 RepID=A1AVU3_RUTMC|nr:DnaA/Hda family protein [Candidatus Ruthturnera calyptogenae]ABL02050.1 regulatory inactivation of DnaA Hda protein [Candidatus Ruthia magnifica str. Cm (Calyptogena magnifica)]
MNQLGLPLSLNSKMLLSNFIGKKNQQVLDFVNQLLTQKSSAVVFISGAKSSGKTHLLQGCAFSALDGQLGVIYIDIKQELPEGIINDLVSVDWICIDNVDYLSIIQQQALFDLYNRIKLADTKLIVSAGSLPGELNLLKDLKTRLSLAVVFTLETLNDEQKILIIERKMTDININIDIKVYHYLFKVFSRDLNDVLNAINILDETSLQKKNNISIPFVKQTLGI